MRLAAPITSRSVAWRHVWSAGTSLFVPELARDVLCRRLSPATLLYMVVLLANESAVAGRVPLWGRTARPGKSAWASHAGRPAVCGTFAGGIPVQMTWLKSNANSPVGLAVPCAKVRCQAGEQQDLRQSVEKADRRVPAGGP